MAIEFDVATDWLTKLLSYELTMLLTSETLAALSIPEVAFVTSAARSLSDTLPELAPASTLI